MSGSRQFHSHPAQDRRWRVTFADPGVVNETRRVWPHEVSDENTSRVVNAHLTVKDSPIDVDAWNW